ncbi:hypothetical protein HMPREF9370_2472 [Neisseria wadsworthii 9715]|uniref:Uncharacterized protein n=1 Tax=Neisseria wadsworthii 9715 TaxID=1030841 RepID=G4CTR2_9NEIS|nr:hypothetical protein HMPREF9370_2472 [Neisseria wadsworthii 9715]
MIKVVYNQGRIFLVLLRYKIKRAGKVGSVVPNACLKKVLAAAKHDVGFAETCFLKFSDRHQ